MSRFVNVSGLVRETLYQQMLLSEPDEAFPDYRRLYEYLPLADVLEFNDSDFELIERLLVGREDLLTQIRAPCARPDYTGDLRSPIPQEPWHENDPN